MSSACLTNIIGLSETTCPCFDAGKPADFNVSTSGYFLDKTEGLNIWSIDCLDDCSEGNLWEKMEDARDEACLHFETDFLSLIQAQNTLKRQPFKGFIGERSKSGPLPKLGDFHGIKFSVCREVKGGFIYIKNVGTLFNSTKTGVEVNIYNNVEDAPLFTFQIDSVANQLKRNDVSSESIVLPLWNDECIDEELEYYILYQPTDFLPLNNKVHCGCRGKKYGWEGYVDVDGVYGDDVTDITTRDDFDTDSYMNGLLVEIETGCNMEHLICDYISDVYSNPIHRSIGRTIQFRAAEILIESVLSSGEINRFTLLNNEKLYGKRNHFRKEYQMRVEWLSENVDLSKTDCVNCGNDKVIGKTTILT